MPEVFIEATLSSGGLKVVEKLLLNSGARGVELAIRESVAKKLKLKAEKKVKVYPVGSAIEADAASVEITIEDPEGRKRRSLLEAIILPDEILDCSLIGVVGQEKLRIIPDTSEGKVIFK